MRGAATRRPPSFWLAAHGIVNLLGLEQDLDAQALVGILEVASQLALDAPDAVEQRAAVDEQGLCGLGYAHAICQVAAKRLDVAHVRLAVVLDEALHAIGEVHLERKVADGVEHELHERVVLEDVAARVLRLELRPHERGKCLVVVQAYLEQVRERVADADGYAHCLDELLQVGLQALEIGPILIAQVIDADEADDGRAVRKGNAVGKDAFHLGADVAVRKRGEILRQNHLHADVAALPRQAFRAASVGPGQSSRNPRGRL